MPTSLKLVEAPASSAQPWDLYLEELRDLAHRVRLSGMIGGDERCALLAEALAKIDSTARTL